MSRLCSCAAGFFVDRVLSFFFCSMLYSFASSVLAQGIISELDDNEAGQASFVIVYKSHPAFTMFMAIPEEKLEEMRPKLAGQKEILFLVLHGMEE